MLVIYIWMHACIYAPWGTNTPWPVIINQAGNEREKREIEKRNAKDPTIHWEV